MNNLNLIAQFLLPIPPSVNHYTKRTKNGGVMLTEKAKEYKRDVYQMVGRLAPSEPIEGKLAGEFIFHFGSEAITNQRDLDNCMKLVLDSLQDAQFFRNDCQFWELSIKKGEVVKGGNVEVTLCEIA